MYALVLGEIVTAVFTKIILFIIRILLLKYARQKTAFFARKIAIALKDGYLHKSMWEKAYIFLNIFSSISNVYRQRIVLGIRCGNKYMLTGRFFKH